MNCECTAARQRCQSQPGNDIQYPVGFFLSEVSSVSKESWNGLVGRRSVKLEQAISRVEAMLYKSLNTHGAGIGQIALESSIQRNHPRENRVSSIH